MNHILHFLPIRNLNRLLHRLPKRDFKSERSTLYFFKSHILPLPSDVAHLGGRKLSIQTQYGSIRHHLDSIFLQLVLLLVSDSFPYFEKMSGVALNDQNQLEIWVQQSPRSIDTVKQFLLKQFADIMNELGLKEPVPSIDDKPIKPLLSPQKREHKAQ